MRGILLGLCVLALGCSSSTSKAGNCRVDGTYSVTSMQEGTACLSTSVAADALVTSDGSTATVSLPGVRGSCTGPLDGCRFQFDCELRDLNSNVVIATSSGQWIFTETGLHGGEDFTFLEPTSCRATYMDDGILKP